MTLFAFGLLLAFILLSSSGQICMKKGLGSEKIPVERSPVRTVKNILKVIVRPWVLAGLAFYVCGAFAWLLLISRVRLSVAYPMVSISYALVILQSAFILREKVIWKYAIAGVLFIGAGVSFIGFGLGRM